MFNIQRINASEVSLSRQSIIFLGITVLVATVFGLAISVGPLGLFLPAVGAMLWLSLLLQKWPKMALLTLDLGMSVTRYSFKVADLTVMLERVVIPVIAILLLLQLAVNKNKLKLGWSHLGLAVFIIANAAGALANAPDTGESLKLLLLAAITSLPIWLIPNIARDFALVRFGFFALIFFGTIVAVLGLVSLALYYLAGLEHRCPNRLFNRCCSAILHDVGRKHLRQFHRCSVGRRSELVALFANSHKTPMAGLPQHRNSLARPGRESISGGVAGCAGWLDNRLRLPEQETHYWFCHRCIFGNCHFVVAPTGYSRGDRLASSRDADFHAQ